MGGEGVLGIIPDCPLGLTAQLFWVVISCSFWGYRRVKGKGKSRTASVSEFFQRSPCFPVWFAPAHFNACESWLPASLPCRYFLWDYVSQSLSTWCCSWPRGWKSPCILGKRILSRLFSCSSLVLSSTCQTRVIMVSCMVSLLQPFNCLQGMKTIHSVGKMGAARRFTWYVFSKERLLIKIADLSPHIFLEELSHFTC